MAQFPLTTHHQHAEINEWTKLKRKYSVVYQEASAKKAETTKRLRIHSFSAICSALIFAQLKGMTEHTDALCEYTVSTVSLTRSPTLLFLLCVLNH